MEFYIINGKEIKFKVHIFEGKQSLEYYENQIYSALSKIGIAKDFIEIKIGDDKNSYAQVLWFINKNQYSFKCESQDEVKLNLGAISQAICEDIRQIMRGIKGFYTIMNQYEKKEFISKKRIDLLNFTSSRDKEETFPFIKNEFDLPIDAKLDKKYYYLMSYSILRLDVIYLKLKEECINQNIPNHPMLIALKIVRKKKGLKL